MSARSALRLLFTCIFFSILAVTVWASSVQPVWEYGGLKSADRAWNIATLCDAYAGFLTFYAWVFYRERSAAARVLWLVGILLLGNMVMSAYVLLALWKLPADAPIESLLLRPRS